MSRRRTIMISAAALLAAGTALGAWQLHPRAERSAGPDTELPIPPFPPRIAEGSDYESCLSALSTDPVSAIALAEAWEAKGGGEGAVHCRGLALIAVGKPDTGAEVLEQLAARTPAPALARASVLSQAAQARLMLRQADQAAQDTSRALDLAPEDTELLIMRATAEAQLNDNPSAIADLTEALRLDGRRSDALVSRAVLRRKLNQLDLAQADITRALVLDPDSADALLERGILRQRMGDRDGARADWERARFIDPNSTTADLAAQNLALLDAGQARE